jgi:uncharacterized repeat protein (TIGR03943 family)
MISRPLSFFAPAAVLSAWAVVMLHTIATGHINRLLSPMFRGYVLVAAVLLLVLSALYVLLYEPPAESGAGSHRLRQLGRWLVLLLPVIAAAVLSPDAISNTTMINRGLDPTSGVTPMPSWDAANQQSVKEALAADPNQPAPVEVTDLITLAHTPDQMRSFEGRKVTCVGRLFAAQDGAPPKLVRLIMWCCAADAQPASVDLTGDVKGAWKDTDWLEVVGTAHFTAANGKVTPSIQVESIKTTQEPDEPFLSP